MLIWIQKEKCEKETLLAKQANPVSLAQSCLVFSFDVMSPLVYHSPQIDCTIVVHQSERLVWYGVVLPWCIALRQNQFELGTEE